MNRAWHVLWMMGGMSLMVLALTPVTCLFWGESTSHSILMEPVRMEWHGVALQLYQRAVSSG
jgi:hypothetical protein